MAWCVWGGGVCAGSLSVLFPPLISASNHVHNHVSKSGETKSRDQTSTNGKRRRSKEADNQDDVWTEHTSSSGRTYYYNKRLDKSQWEQPSPMLKKLVLFGGVDPNGS